MLLTLAVSAIMLNAVCAVDVNGSETLGDDGFSSIQTLIDDAKPGDSINLENKTYYGSGSAITINKDIYICGGGPSTILDANSTSNIFVVSKNANVCIEGLTLINGHANNGAAVDNYGKLTIIDSVIRNNVADRGAVHCSDKSNLNVFNSSFENNVAVSGAAIENDNANGIVEITNTTFINNSCEEGGAIYNIWGEFFVYDSIFTNNFASRGGAIYNNRGTLKVYNSKVTSNVCDDLGAGIKSWGICEVYDSIIANNTNTVKQGGGFYVSEFSLKLQNCIVENNTAVWGGGVYVEAKAKLTVKNSSISNNAAERGGGIDVNQGAIDVTDSIVNNNVATDEGGAIRCSFMDSQIMNTIINNNVAKWGGAVYNDHVNVKITGVTIKNNSADEGGAIYSTGTLNLKDCTLNDNTAVNNGGAIYNKDTLTLTNVAMNRNKASIYGGAIYNVMNSILDNVSTFSNEAKFGGAIYSDRFIQIYNSKFSENKASEGGALYSSKTLVIYNSQFMNNQISRKGAALSVSGEINITDSLFELNRGADEGGAVFIYEGNVNIVKSQFISNTAKSYGGAIDNSGELTLVNSSFDKNQAYGAGAIDNGGKLDIIGSNFTNNKASVNGGAIDNKGNMVVLGSIFEGNVAEGDGGAVIARRNTTISHSIIRNNYDANGFAIFNNTWDNVDVSNNWWGSNHPNFEKLLNFNTSDEFKWIIMKFENTTPLTKSANVIVSFNNVLDRSNNVSQLNNSELLPMFKVALSNGDVLSVEDGYISKSVAIPSTNSITANIDNESITLKSSVQPVIKRIINNKDVVVDYNGKATFKVRVIGDDGNPVGKGVTIVMKIGSTSYKVTTDSNGYASRTFGFKPGKYYVTTSYKGYSVKNTITIKNVLKAKSVTVKKSSKVKYTATLKNSKGKAIIGKNVVFKIKGKTYTGKTNSKGVATVYFKNLNAGKYTVTVKYINSQVKTALKVKK